MTLPNFFIVGAQKAGTTSLYHYLDQHPQVYMSPVKEPFFFNHEIDASGRVVPNKFKGHEQPPRFSDLEEYRTLFSGVGTEVAIGEASPLYIYVPGTPERIKRFVSEAKSIVLLRNPADRAYSAFLHAVRIGAEPLRDFDRALHVEDSRIRDGWHYIFHYRNRGLYHAQLERYFQIFDRSKIGVWLYEDLRDDPASVVQSTFRFLDVDDGLAVDHFARYNPAGVPEGLAARTAMRATDRTVGALRRVFPPTSSILPFVLKARRAVQNQVFTEPPRIDPEIRMGLIDWYRTDILKLQDLLERDLSVWLR